MNTLTSDAATRGTAPARKLLRRVEQVMGMPISLAFDGRWAGSAKGDAAWDAALDSLRETDAIFSTYRDDSWISRLNRGEADLADCPRMVAEVFDLADAAREASDGAFDINLPGQDGRVVLDPSGIVKGWAVDRAAQHLRQLEDTDFCLSAGGDMVCSTTQSGSPDWRIGIENPRDPSKLIAVVPLRNGAIATSGLVHRGAHITDPRTPGVPSVWASVSVVAPTLVEADVDATAAFVLGEQAPSWLSLRPGRCALLVRPNGSQLNVGFDC